MADMGRLISEADAYGDERFDEGKRSRQGEVDGLTQQRDALTTQLNAAHVDVELAQDAYDELQAQYDAHMATHTPPSVAKTIIGMSALPGDWATRLAQVDPAGVKARRIFCDFTADGRSRASIIEAAVAAGMTPVVSYKGSPTPANVAAVRTYLTSLGVPVFATWHHEPYDDMDGTAYKSGARAFLAARSATVKVGPIFHGWLLDANVPLFASYTDADLLAAWDFVGIDSYETARFIPGDRIPVLVAWLAEQGRASTPIIVGEYNGKTAESIAASGETFLSTPQVAVACMWNNTGSGGAEATPLSGARLAAFKATKADPRALK